MHIRDKKGVSLLLKIEIINIYAMIRQISVKLRLLWELALSDLLAPEGMLPQVLPIDTLYGVFLKTTCQKVVEYRGEAFYLGRFLLTDLLDEVF